MEDKKYWIIDGNKWSKNRYSLEEAYNYSKTLKECVNCIDCIECSYCTNCINCEKCVLCFNCEDCNDCKYCVESEVEENPIQNFRQPKINYEDLLKDAIYKQLKSHSIEDYKEEEVVKKKYRLDFDTKIKNDDGKTLYRIVALRDFGDVKAGDVGGYVESEKNLSHYGNCWIYDDAEVYDNAKVKINAKILDRASVFGNAIVTDNSSVCHNAMVYGNAKLNDLTLVKDCSKVFDDAILHGDIVIDDGSKVYGHATLSGRVELYSGSEVYGNADIGGCIIDHSKVYGNADIESLYYDIYISYGSKIYGNAKVTGFGEIYGKTITDEVNVIYIQPEYILTEKVIETLEELRSVEVYEFPFEFVEEYSPVYQEDFKLKVEMNDKINLSIVFYSHEEKQFELKHTFETPLENYDSVINILGRIQHELEYHPFGDIKPEEILSPNK